MSRISLRLPTPPVASPHLLTRAARGLRLLLPKARRTPGRGAVRERTPPQPLREVTHWVGQGVIYAAGPHIGARQPQFARWNDRAYHGSHVAGTAF